MRDEEVGFRVKVFPTRRFDTVSHLSTWQERDTARTDLDAQLEQEQDPNPNPYFGRRGTRPGKIWTSYKNRLAF